MKLNVQCEQSPNLSDHIVSINLVRRRGVVGGAGSVGLLINKENILQVIRLFEMD